MAKEKDITGLKFNHLTAIQRVYGYGNGRTVYWEFECDCEKGKRIITSKSSVMRGETLSCGCHIRKLTSQRLTKHGGYGSRIYVIWRHMKQRCYNPKHKCYDLYGGRGIKICDEWLGEKGFENFRKWAYENGYDDKAEKYKCTIDRTNNDLGYSPQNCRWVDMECQINNRRGVHIIEAFGEKHSIEQWARILGMCNKTISHRIFSQGMSPEEALTKPSRRKHNNLGDSL